MNTEVSLVWPSGDCKPVLATKKTPMDLARVVEIIRFRDKDDLDWFDGAKLKIDEVGDVLIMRHDNNPLGITVFYVDAGCDSSSVEEKIVQYFNFINDDVVWWSSRGI
ncbi:hypothetical protein [Janthinobacterium sp. 1_2014MBL_MicDiv]|uniref:hypothetical protein n=1 Tax=Janthinobacterium sp. 1_2014MBL_MicDiv TaxID=1644131 RepID=UPI0012EB5E60|nr:hypothetical protein [Janthinobacterium sp. 1_2014MBL_MicDiv]